MAVNWYALKSKPNKEDFFWGQLLSQQIETYYPRLFSRPVNPRSRKYRPFFPGYLFVHVDLENINSSTLNWMPGSGGMVSFDHIPASVPDNLIVAIRRKVEAMNLNATQPLLGVKKGDIVRITDGPFMGQDAIFDGCKNGEERVRVLIHFLRERQIPIELPLHQIAIARP